MIIIKGTRTIDYEIPVYKYLDYFQSDDNPEKSIKENLENISEEELLNISTFVAYQEKDIVIAEK